MLRLQRAEAFSKRRLWMLGTVCGLLALLMLGLPWSQVPLARSGAQRPAVELGHLPLTFEPNLGQAGPAIKLLTHALGGMIGFGEREVRLALPAADGKRAATAQIEFLDSNPHPTIVPGMRFHATGNYYIGNDPAQWHAKVPLYAGLTYQALYPGIDLYYSGEAGVLKGTYVVQPQSDPGQIQWSYKGASVVQLDPQSGDLHVAVQGAKMLQEHVPVAWQTINGQRISVDAQFTVSGDRVGFVLGRYDHKQPLTIDPTLVYSTYLGGTSVDDARGIAVDSQGYVYVVGDTFSEDFLGAGVPVAGGSDVIVVKFRPGTNEPATFDIVGGSGYDDGLAVIASPSGEVYVTADPDSADFPLKNPIISTPPDSGDGILIKFTSDLDVAASTYIGFGMGTSETTRNLAFDPHGNVVVVGDAYDPHTVARALGIATFNPNVSQIVFQTQIGQVMPGTAVTVDRQGAIYVTGTESDIHGTDLPVTANALQRVCGNVLQLGTGFDCDEDAYVLVLNAAGSVTYASYLGRDGDDNGEGIAVGNDGSIWVTGNTMSPHFPTTSGALQPTCSVNPATQSCYYDTFVSKLATGGASLVFSTYLAGTEKTGEEFARGLVLDANGNGYVAGFTNSSRFPVKDAPQPALSPGTCFGGAGRPCFDAYVASFTPTGSLVYSTYLGGNLDEYCDGIALDGAGNAYIAGYTESPNFPVTSNAFQPTWSGNDDFFVSEIGSGGGGTSGNYKVYVPLVRR